jgi:Protein of unknown function (DUF3006)
MSIDSGQVVIDRFESGLAVLVFDGGEVVEVSRDRLPAGSEPGVVLRVQRDEEGMPIWSGAQIDESATEERIQEAESILKDLRQRDPGGDIVL